MKDTNDNDTGIWWAPTYAHVEVPLPEDVTVDNVTITVSDNTHAIKLIGTDWSTYNTEKDTESLKTMVEETRKTIDRLWEQLSTKGVERRKYQTQLKKLLQKRKQAHDPSSTVEQ